MEFYSTNNFALKHLRDSYKYTLDVSRLNKNSLLQSKLIKNKNI